MVGKENLSAETLTDKGFGLVTERGFEVKGETHILAVKTEVFPEKFTEHLIHEHNVWVTPVWFVAKPCLRIMVNSTLTKSEMDRLIDAMTKTRAFLSSVPALTPKLLSNRLKRAISENFVEIISTSTICTESDRSN